MTEGGPGLQLLMTQDCTITETETGDTRHPGTQDRGMGNRGLSVGGGCLSHHAALPVHTTHF